MKRELFGHQISQKSKSEFFSATDLVKAGNEWRKNEGLNNFNLSQYLKNKNSKEFLLELEKKYNTKCKIVGRGAGANTWVHPLLFIDIALAINPMLKIEVYEWLFDHLIKYRNQSGDSYKEMCGSLYDLHTNKKEFPAFMSKVANNIRVSLGVIKWEKATQDQLKKRDQIHVAIKLFSNVLSNVNEAVRLGINEYVPNFKLLNR